MPIGVWWRCEVKEATSPLTTSPFCLQWWHHPPSLSTRISHHSMSPCVFQTLPHTHNWRALHVSVGRWWFCCPVCELEWCSGLIPGLVCRSAPVYSCCRERTGLSQLQYQVEMSCAALMECVLCEFNRLFSRIICLWECLSDWARWRA